MLIFSEFDCQLQIYLIHIYWMPQNRNFLRYFPFLHNHCTDYFAFMIDGVLNGCKQYGAHISLSSESNEHNQTFGRVSVLRRVKQRRKENESRHSVRSRARTFATFVSPSSSLYVRAKTSTTTPTFGFGWVCMYWWIWALTKTRMHGIALIIPATNKRDNIWGKNGGKRIRCTCMCWWARHYLSSVPSRFLHVFAECCSKNGAGIVECPLYGRHYWFEMIAVQFVVWRRF